MFEGHVNSGDEEIIGGWTVRGSGEKSEISRVANWQWLRGYRNVQLSDLVASESTSVLFQNGQRGQALRMHASVPFYGLPKHHSPVYVTSFDRSFEEKRASRHDTACRIPSNDPSFSMGNIPSRPPKPRFL